MYLDAKSFEKTLRDTLESNITLEHPIVAELFKNKNTDLLKKLTLQGYQLTKHFLEYIETLYIRCPEDEFKTKLLYNLFEEETGHLSKTKNHVHLMHDFIRAIGISDEERDAAEPLPATQELIDFRMRNVKGKDTYHIGAAAVMIASEGQNLETKAGEARHSILGKYYGLEEEDMLFFSVHQEEDVYHVQDGLGLVVSHCSTEEMQQQAIYAVDHTCKLFWNMYENVYQLYLEETAQ